VYTAEESIAPLCDNSGARQSCKGGFPVGPALETFLTVFVLGLLIAVALAFVTRPLWRRFFCALKIWYERDRERETEQKHQVERRREAEKEVTAWCAPEPDAATEERPARRGVRKDEGNVP